MTRFFIYLLFLFVAAGVVAQVNVSGTVVDKENNEPLTGASVIVKGADGKIKKYATSKGDGGFSMSLPAVSYRLSVGGVNDELRQENNPSR